MPSANTNDKASASANAAISAEPSGIGSAEARDPLSREVKLLGALLGQVIAEQAGPEVLELVEEVRRLTIDLRRGGRAVHRRRLRAILEELSPDRIEDLVRAFSLYFHLTNLAEEKHRVRRIRKRARSAPAGQEGSIDAAIIELGRGGVDERDRSLIEELRIGLVLTAHPTEARRRTMLVALRRCFALLDRLDDPRLTPGEDADIRRRLREEISLLWRTSTMRLERPSPLDEVRTALTFFDESLFVVTPRLYRTLDSSLDRSRWLPDVGAKASEDGSVGPSAPAVSAPSTVRNKGAAASDSGRTGTRPPAVDAFLRWGTWVGGDRDGHPHVTAETTRQAVAIGADHVLHGYEAVALRLMYTIAPAVPEPEVDAALAARLVLDEDDLGDAYEELRRRFPDEPYRRRFGSIVERLRRTRRRLLGGIHQTGGYDTPAQLVDELGEIRNALVADDMARVAYGEVQDLRWQVETFGFHALSMEIRQHSDVHAATLRALADGGDSDDIEVSRGVKVAEVIDTFRAIADIQARFGPDACHRYVISFTRKASDVTDVLELARHAALSPDAIDVVPLLESADALEGADEIFDGLMADPAYRTHLARRGDHQEVMLGYSDSTKESGALAAAWLLTQAETKLAEAAARHGIRLTLFHGRGGAIGRGGGPMHRAILASAPNSLRGQLKITEQGEVVADRYANGSIALRHLEQLTNAVLVASSAAHEDASSRAAERGATLLDDLARRSAKAYQALVWDDPAFQTYFLAATPIAELSGLTLGSRPAARNKGTVELETLRAIPWVFSWSQARTNLPAWYGLGTAIETYEAEHGPAATTELQALYRESPFLTGVIDVVEMALAKADMQVSLRYASLAEKPDARRIWRSIRGEYHRTVAAVLRISGREHLLDASPSLQRSIALRNPYVDSLSELQVMLLGRLRELPADDPGREPLRRLVQLTVSGVAAGLQNTG